MTGTGSAIVNTPANAHKAPTNIPKYVLGAISPYPTVVMVTMAHQRPSGILLKQLFGLLCKFNNILRLTEFHLQRRNVHIISFFFF